MDYLGRDLRMDAGDFKVDAGGDVELAGGLSCLAQDLTDRLTTERGSLWSHPEYGARVLRFLQVEDTALNRLALEQELRLAAEQDPRAQQGSVLVTVDSWSRDRISARVSVTPIGSTHPLNLVIGFGVTEITAEVLALGL